MPYTVEYHVPFPEQVPGCAGLEGRPVKYPWSDMDVGGSFWKECPEGKLPSDVGNGLTSAARNWARNNSPGCKFTSRQEGNGARIWRIS